MTVTTCIDRPTGHRSVPLLQEPAVDHYPEFARFLADAFGLDDDPFRPPGLLDVDGRLYELVFTGRSGRAFPAGVEINALVAGLEPLDVDQADRDLLQVMTWLVEGAGPPWTAEALEQTSQIFLIAARSRPDGG